MILYDAKSTDVATRIYTGEFTWNGTTVTKTRGLGWTISLPQNGTARIALTEISPAILYWGSNLSNASASAERTQNGAAVAANGTVDFNFLDANSALANPSTEETIVFTILVRNSTVS